MKAAFVSLAFVLLLIGCQNPTDSSGPYKTASFEIGSWDMVASAGKAFSYSDYGLPGRDSILSISAIIYQDGGSAFDYFPLDYYGSGSYILSATEIQLYRDPSTQFNSVTYNDSSINRGKVTVSYYQE